MKVKKLKWEENNQYTPMNSIIKADIATYDFEAGIENDRILTYQIDPCSKFELENGDERWYFTIHAYHYQKLNSGGINLTDQIIFYSELYPSENETMKAAQAHYESIILSGIDAEDDKCDTCPYYGCGH